MGYYRIFNKLSKEWSATPMHLQSLPDEEFTAHVEQFEK
jgi:hypothetical protein